MSATLNNKLRLARELLQRGDADGAASLCAGILSRAPRNPEARTLRGIASLMAGRPDQARQDLQQALAAAPRDGTALEYLGFALLTLGEFTEAEKVLRQATALPGAPASAWFRLGMALLHQGRPAESTDPLRQALRLSPDNPDCLLGLGRALAASGDAAGAAARFREALAAAPGHPDALFNLGVLELAADRLAAAKQHFESVLAADAGHADAMVNLAIVLERENAVDAARGLLRRALNVSPAHPHAHSNLGRLELLSSRHAEARRHFEAALAAAPALPAALEGMGALARALGRYGEAVRWYREAAGRDAPDAATLSALAECLLQAGELEAADEAAATALALDPAAAWPHGLRAQIATLRGDLGDAVAMLEKAVAATGSSALLGMLVQNCRHVCDWERWHRAWAALKPRILAGEDAGTPFALLCEDLSAEELLAYTRAWAARRFGALLDAPPPRSPALPPDRRIRIGYLSSDFQEHPAAYLIAELLELHDRAQFEVFAYSHGPADDGVMRRRIRGAVDHFIDIAWEPDDLAFERMRGDDLDILVDLKGYTVGDRLGIMARRPAPVQVTWLGYPGTTGTGFIDWLIADPRILPVDAATGCSERVIRMPQCYQPTDRRRVIAAPQPRAAYGLPASGPVLCCFNQTFKITPGVFAAWMQVLQAVPDAVLWLVDGNRWATANLRRAAAAAGITEQRLVFAPRLPLAEHLARYAVADLALDTFPYTSHTTASDALWCGCPLVALCGETFAARVSASILQAAGLPDLVHNDLETYTRQIIALAGDPAAKAAVAARAAQARSDSALFDTPAFTRDLEDLYRQMLGGSAVTPA